MRFAPQKYILTHFTWRRCFDLEAPIRIQDRVIAPSPVVRILGLQLDTKPRWHAHTKAIDKKMKAQMYALSRTVASTWGATVEKARLVYLAVIRSASSYGAALWYCPTEPKKRRKGPAAKL
jgi:hypothetical protein